MLDEISNDENKLIFEGNLYQYYEESHEILDYAKDFIDMINSLNLYIIEIHKQTIIDLNNEIIKKSLLEKNLVLMIFILQFFIFVIVQFFEISSINFNAKIKKLIK